MEQFEETLLWERTLADGRLTERTESARQRLRNAFLSFRKRAIVLADEIPQNLRSLTVHDATHIDALWEVADLIIGNDYDVNPAEAFILGSTFLLHDLGMSLSSYKDGLSDLKSHASWPDIVFPLLQSSLKRKPTDTEIANPGTEIEIQATNQLLRDLHAKHAAELALLGFGCTEAETYFLIEDVEIRTTLGGLIGQIAYSHWWSIENVAKHFSRKIGAMVFCPREWTIDPLKIACILRASDACHLDARRAPGFLKVLRNPTGLSELHWDFQEHIQKPTVENQRLVFTASRPFGRESNKAWWLCFETLGMADRELRNCDSVLSDLGRTQFAVRGVAGSEAPDRLRTYIPTVDWEPVDIKVRVGNVPGLVKKLGGVSLYGDNVLVPLRELIQNAGDAVRARRIFEERAPEFGMIQIEFAKSDDKEIVRVSDSGLGMTRDVLIGPFLDFGESYWGGNLMQREHPGLIRKGFQSVGGFGIGFYSVFMWGDNVKVITRGRSSGPAETLVLHFQEGLTGRPILRIAETAEQLQEPGTTICIELKNTSFNEIQAGVRYKSAGLYFQRPAHAPQSLDALCGWLCPISDTEIRIIHKEAYTAVAVKPNDWITIDAETLLKRISSDLSKHNELAKSIAARIKPLIQDGITVARLGICVDLLPRESNWYADNFPTSTITAGLLRADASFVNVAGVSMGVASTASRLSANSVLQPATTRNWANKQRDLIKLPLDSVEIEVDIANTIRVFGGDTGPLRIAETATGHVSFDEIAGDNRWPDEVILVQDAHWHLEKRSRPKTRLKNNVISVDSSRQGLEESFAESHLEKASKGNFWEFHHCTLKGAVIEALALSWGVSLNDVIASMDDATDDHKVSAEWAVLPNGKQISYDHLTILRRPRT